MKAIFNNTNYTIMKTHILNINEIDIAAQYIKNGELVAFPTETVYGL
jgi:L-threonylcarbamoyladenylate synthase